MKILKIALRNYRGVVDRTVEFAPSGVTIVEGPNEIGKSSIAEAIDRIIEDMDSTSRQRVVAVKPVDRDVGPEVIIEVETGKYVFRYKKRFLRDRVTELDITRPSPEHHTGRGAHDRVLSILSETVDMALWKALRMQQGEVVGQAPLADQTSLSAALDRSAGEAPVGDEEVSLFGLAHLEYLRYWTETGRRKQVVIEMERTIDRLASDIEGITDAIRAIDADIESSVRLQAEARGIAERQTEHRDRVTEHQAWVDTLAKVEVGVEGMQARFESARLVAADARRTSQARYESITAIEEARTAQAEHERAVAEDAPLLEVAKERVVEADHAAALAHTERDSARTSADEAQARLSLGRDVADLASLSDRRDRATKALAAIEAAATDAALPIDTAMLASIRDQHRAVELARARLDATRPLVHVEPLRAVELMVDNVPMSLIPGTTLDRHVDRLLRISVPDVASISVEVGGAGDPTAVDLETCEQRLRDLLFECDAKELSEAERLHSLREEAVRTVAEQQRTLKQTLDGLTMGSLEQRIAAIQGRIATHPATSVAGNDFEEDARASADVARQRLALAEQAVRGADAEREAAHAKLAEVEIARSQRNAELRLATEDVERRDAVLASARGTSSDDFIAADLTAAEAAEEARRAELETAQAGLSREGPEQARELLANASKALARIDGETRQIEDELLAVTTRLRDHGEDGLAEDLQEALANREHAELEMRRYLAHAASRKMLYETLGSERDESRRAYVAPLRREIENLGKIVFGPDFGVELDDVDLSVISRSLKGRTIPFRSLSVGAQEQIALISRLACATIVAPDGGVPVIIDDALGNSDPQRLEAMGAVLAVAGRQSQIVVLTCQPDRYEHVGDARIVRLS